MRSLILKDFWAQKGARFANVNGVEFIKDFGDSSSEYALLRHCAVLSDFSFLEKFEYPESAGIDFLDTVLADNILKLRYGKIIDTFLANSNGEISAEVFVGNIDDKIFTFAESVDDFSRETFSSGKCLDDSCVLLSLDGPQSWKIVKEIFGSDILNLSYLSIEKYAFDSSDVYLIRNGKTGDFGYQLLVEADCAVALAERIYAELQKIGGGLCGFDAHSSARMSGNFFNIYAEGSLVKNPLQLGLQWQADFEKESFSGSEKIFSKRLCGVSKKLIAVSSTEHLKVGDKIFDGDFCVGEIVALSPVKFEGASLGLALADESRAYPSLDFSFEKNAAQLIKSVSRPTIIAESLIRGMED